MFGQLCNGWDLKIFISDFFFLVLLNKKNFCKICEEIIYVMILDKRFSLLNFPIWSFYLVLLNKGNFCEIWEETIYVMRNVIFEQKIQPSYLSFIFNWAWPSEGSQQAWVKINNKESYGWQKRKVWVNYTMHALYKTTKGCLVIMKYMLPMSVFTEWMKIWGNHAINVQTSSLSLWLNGWSENRPW